MWDEIKLSSWDEFVTFISENEMLPKKWIFRGQSSADWNLESTYYRANLHIQDIYKTAKIKRSKLRDIFEKELIEIFKSQSHLYLNLNPEKEIEWATIIEKVETSNKSIIPEKTLEWLTIMQHYGAPTRLLDWSFSPFIAAFFALEKAADTCCVFALNNDLLSEENELRFGDINFAREAFRKRNGEQQFVFAYEPLLKNERIVRQQGVFLVPSSNYQTFDKILSGYSFDTKDFAYKILFDKGLRLEALQNLKLMNISHEVLFPGVDGFCRSLSLKLLDSRKNIKRLC